VRDCCSAGHVISISAVERSSGGTIGNHFGSGDASHEPVEDAPKAMAALLERSVTGRVAVAID